MSQEIQPHILERYKIVQKIGSGAYGHVWKVIDQSNGNIMALKKNFDAFANSTDAQRTYRQIMFLRQLSSPYIIKLFKVHRAKNDKDIYLLFEYVDVDLYTLCRDKSILNQQHKKYILYQVAKAIYYLHCADIIHRDLKPSNILVNQQCQIKLCDFGLVRSLDQRNTQNAIMTEYIATRWYRAPQILFSNPKYCKGIDIWGYGCLMGEVMRGKPMFPGTSTQNQLERILGWTGMPTSKQINQMHPYVNKQALQHFKPRTVLQKKQFVPSQDPSFHILLEKTLKFSPKNRPSIQQILSDPYFQQFYKNEKQEIKNILKNSQKITVPVDDNMRLSVNQYRQLIYCQIACYQKDNSKKINQIYKAKSPIISIHGSNKNQNKTQHKKKQNYDKIYSMQQSYEGSRTQSTNKKQAIKKKKKGISLYSKKLKTQGTQQSEYKHSQQKSIKLKPSKENFQIIEQKLKQKNKQQNLLKKCIQDNENKKIKRAVNINTNFSNKCYTQLLKSKKYQK